MRTAHQQDSAGSRSMATASTATPATRRKFNPLEYTGDYQTAPTHNKSSQDFREILYKLTTLESGLMFNGILFHVAQTMAGSHGVHRGNGQYVDETLMIV